MISLEYSLIILKLLYLLINSIIFSSISLSNNLFSIDLLYLIALFRISYILLIKFSFLIFSAGVLLLIRHAKYDILHKHPIKDK